MAQSQPAPELSPYVALHLLEATAHKSGMMELRYEVRK